MLFFIMEISIFHLDVQILVHTSYLYFGYL